MPKYIQVGNDVVEFPDGMSDSEIESVLSGNKAKSGPPPVTLYGGLDSLTGAVRGGADIASTLGKNMFAGGAATLGGMLGLQDSPETMLSAYNQISDKYQAQPQTPIGQNVIGGLSRIGEKVDTAITDVAGMVPGGPLAQTFAKTALTGPLELLGYGKLKGPGGSVARGPGFKQSGYAGPMPEVPLPTAGIGVNDFVPSTSEVFKMANMEFNRARMLGGQISENALAKASRRFSEFKNDVGLNIVFDEDLHGPAFSVQQKILNELQSGDVNFDRLMTLRELAGEVAGSPDKAVSMRGVMLKNELDNFVRNLKAEDMLGGNPKAASAALDNARAMWRDASAARTIEREIELAKIDAGDATGHGLEHKLRNRFRQLARRIEKGQERGFKPDEVAMIRKIAATGNPLQLLSKMSINHPIYAAIGGSAAALAGGPLLAASALGVGQLSRMLLDKRTLGLANRASELARSGGLLNQ